MVSVRAVEIGDWELLRDVRLTALQEAPFAFGSTYAREAPLTEEQWRGRISERPVTFFAYAADLAEPAGLAGVYEEDGAADLGAPGRARRGRRPGAGGSGGRLGEGPRARHLAPVGHRVERVGPPAVR